jgi:hypothetical protein
MSASQINERSLRPRVPDLSTPETEAPRTKCCLCCGVRFGAMIFAGTFALGLPFGLARTGFQIRGLGLLGFINEYCLLPIPFALMATTHHMIISEGLWSKNKKTVWDVNWQATALNIALWTGILSVSTLASRKYLPPRSQTYRLLLWEYQRSRRSVANKYMPSVSGRITEDLDWYQFAWFGSIYHVLWGAVTTALDKNLHSHYGMFYRQVEYSRWCSPRWREWRERRVHEELLKEQPLMKGRWGNFITAEKWRATDI